jgi:hypothetical protein
MLIVALALVVVAATAAVVIRDAHPSPPKAAAEIPDAIPEAAAQPLVFDVPTQTIESPQPVADFNPDLDAPTQSMPAPVFFSGGQAAALLPLVPQPEPVGEPEPAHQAAAFVPAGTPYLQADPDHLIQTEVVIDPDAEHSAAVTKLVLGIAVSGAAVGLVIVGAGRGIGLLIHLLLH